MKHYLILFSPRKLNVNGLNLPIEVISVDSAKDANDARLLARECLLQKNHPAGHLYQCMEVKEINPMDFQIWADYITGDIASTKNFRNACFYAANIPCYI